MIEKIGMNGIVKDTTRDYLNNFPLYNYVSSLGSFGKVVFRVSQDNILTPTQVGITVSARHKKHSRIGAVDITEFETRQLKKISLPIKLYRDLCNIKSTLRELTRICEEGEHYPLILARDKIGKHNFCIESFSYSYSKTDGIGEPLVVDINLSLEEYIEKIDRISQIEITEEERNSTFKEKVIYNTNKIVIAELQKERLW
ncbi:phage tail protein [uncultured Fusobacterium sp.]|uniref:phage tail protein n=1 Tax=uncultured Fusobacterium sp. TaxID=159267 RepID=UPI0025FB77CF|nr:phage tail protein [uncultured Fusobacterium sp.]